MRTTVPFSVCLLVVTYAAACSSTHDSGFALGTSDDSGATPNGDDGSSFGDGNAPALGDGGGHQGGSCVVSDPNADMDKDSWSPNQGDCNDCDPNVNPGAVDVLHQGDGGPPTWGDEDCDGTPGDSAKPCDTGLALTDIVASDAAKAIELCVQASTSDRKYGVISAAYVRADGSPLANPGMQVGIQPGFGANVHAQGGQSLLALSTGYARVVGQAGACNGISCVTNPSGTPPTGFPQDDPACPPTKAIADDVALELQIRVPTNATGYSFNLKFYSFEFPDWVCDTSGYNDQFIALVTPPPMGSYVPTGSAGGNISFDNNNHPISVNLGFFDACDPSSPQRFASHCKSGAGPCPALPTPYCPLGLGELTGTGFDVWHSGIGPAGATRWLQTQAPAQPGSVITIRFAIWDAGNSQFDSTVLVDNFTWLATAGTTVTTQPQPAPK
jgi:hypothetical protein